MNEPGPVELDDLCDRSPRGPAHPSVADHAIQSLSRRLAPGDPVGSLAADLCETAICEAMPPEEIERTAIACRRAAEICYGKPPLRKFSWESAAVPRACAGADPGEASGDRSVAQPWPSEVGHGIDPNGLTVAQRPEPLDYDPCERLRDIHELPCSFATASEAEKEGDL